MNKEHFLTLLKIKLRPLGPSKQQVILTDYEERFNELLASGLTEPLVSEKLGDPEEIAHAILEEQQVGKQEAAHDQDDWEEINPELKEAAMAQPTHTPSVLVRFSQIAGVLAFNGLFMIWAIITAILSVGVGWLLVIISLLAPIIGLVVFSISGGTSGLFQLFLSIALCGLGFIGLSIAIPVTKYAWLFLKKYVQWNIHVLRGDY